MSYFKGLIAKGYLNHLNSSETDIALFYFEEFLKVRPGVKKGLHFSKDHFFKKLISNIDLLIDGCYTRYSEPVFDPSVMDNETFEYELNLRREIIIEEIQNDFYKEEFDNEKSIAVNWERCDDAVKLTYALKYKEVSLKDPINIVTNDDNEIVLRKSKLAFLKLEAERANISTITNGQGYLFDESTYLKHIAEKTNQDKPVLNLTDNNVIDEVNSESTKILTKKIDNISRTIESINTGKPLSDYLTAQEAAEYMNWSINTIYSKTSKNEIPFMKKGKKLIFSRIALDVYIKSGKVKTNAEIETEADNFIPKSKRK